MSNIPNEVAKINYLAGKVITGDRALLLDQCRIIQSELTETINALVEGDFTEFRDGVSDVEFTSLGLFALSPFAFDVDMKVVCDSNMEKFDLSEEDAEKTKLKYSAIGVETFYEIVYDLGVTYYITKSTKDQHDYAGKEYPANKWLKSYKWKEPKYPSLAEVADDDFVEIIDSEFSKALDTNTLEEYRAQVVISKLISKHGANAVLKTYNEGAARTSKETQPLLMSVKNPEGWKLEELLEKVAAELEEKNVALTEQYKAAPQVSDLKFMTMMSVSANNAEIVESLKSCADIQRQSMTAFDNLGSDQGPTGTPRV